MNTLSRRTALLGLLGSAIGLSSSTGTVAKEVTVPQAGSQNSKAFETAFNNFRTAAAALSSTDVGQRYIGAESYFTWRETSGAGDTSYATRYREATSKFIAEEGQGYAAELKKNPQWQPLQDAYKKLLATIDNPAKNRSQDFAQKLSWDQFVALVSKPLGSSNSEVFVNYPLDGKNNPLEVIFNRVQNAAGPSHPVQVAKIPQPAPRAP